jgi:uncharacterized protein (DUF2252 family)
MGKVRIAPSGRQKCLVNRRHLKMAQSAHAYVRGNTAKFYEWLESVSATRMTPEGPPIWICGDCHVGNLGPVANTDGKVEIQIRDLDQTVIGNPAHDLLRLGLSLAMAARGSDLPGITTALMMEQMMGGYQLGLSRGSRSKRGEDVAPVRIVLKEALKRKWRHLAEEHIEDVRPRIPLGRRFWQLSKKERAEITTIFDREETRKLITCLRHRDDNDEIEVVDAAYWVKGCSSLGRLRYAVLVGIGKDSRRGFCLVDMKEAVQAAAPRDAEAKMPRDNSERIVQGAIRLSPFLGERMLATKFNDHSMVLRELMPQDLKFEIEDLSQDDAIRIARLFAEVVGAAHAGQMDAKTRNAWASELKSRRPKKLDAPSWLWSSIVELAATHEAAYLEHCRRYALEG